MISNKQNHQFQFEIKSRFFDLITKKSVQGLEDFLNGLTFIIHEVLQSEYTSLYIYREMEKEFIQETTMGEKERLCPHKFSSLMEELEIEQIPGNGDFYKGEGEDYLIPLLQDQEAFGYILVSYPQLAGEDLQANLAVVGRETADLYVRMLEYFQSLNEERRHERLARVTAKFHSSMNMDDVLAEIIDTLRQLYPSFEYYLLLSHDYSTNHNLPIKELGFDNDGGDQLSAEAYLTGQIQFGESCTDNQSCFYAPLKGKQGVYGVLQVLAPKNIHFSDDDIDFITLLANTAGNALENARLYQQSKRLISDLQLINETSHKLNSNLRLSDTISFLLNQIKRSFLAEEVGVLLFQEGNVECFEVLKESTSYFHNDHSKEMVDYLTQSIGKQRDALFIGDFSVKNPYIQSHFHSVMAIPMIQSGSLKGAVIVMHQSPYFFSFETFKLLQSLVHHSTLALANSMLREELERLVSTDYLTKLYSRKHLDETIHKHFVKDKYGSFIIVDIDNFKHVNDTFGHQEGDRIIVEVSNLLKREVGDVGITARWGGEELAIYLPTKQLEEAYQIGKGLVEKVRNFTTPPVTISCGVSYWDVKAEGEVIDLFRRADRALYEAKESGKDCVRKQKPHCN